jgi:hypothetical protein
MKTTYPTHPTRDFNEWIMGVHYYFRMTTSQYLKNKEIRLNTPFRILPNGKGYYVVDGELISKLEFESKYPLPLVLNSTNNNPDLLNDYSKDFI